MTTLERSRNLLLLRFIVLPLMLLTAVLLGGFRVSADHHEFLFIPPTLVDLILSLMIFVLAVRGRLIDIRAWLSLDQTTTTLVSNCLTLLAFFFASAQSLNSVLPEQGLLHWMFSLFFFWTLWNNQFSALDASRTVRSLAVLFGTAFLLKHVIFSALSSADGSWLKQLASGLIENLVISNTDYARYAPATGYVSFFSIMLFVFGLALLPAGPDRFNSNNEVVSLAPSIPDELTISKAPESPAIEGQIVNDDSK